MSEQTPNAPLVPAAPTSMVQTWMNAVTKPSERTFTDIANSPNAKATTAFLWVFIGSLIQFFFAILVGGQGEALRRFLQQQGYAQQLPAPALGGKAIQLICGAPIAAVIGVVFFAIGVGLVHLVAKAFGGRGTYDQLAYSFGAIAVPVYLVSSVLTLLGAIPVVGLCFGILSLLVGIYAIVLEIIAVKGVYLVGWGGAVGAVLIPLVVVFGLICCVFFAIGAAAGAAFGNILNSIQTPTP